MKALHLGKMTASSIFKKKETVCYPFESKPAYEGMRGNVVCAIGDCIFCGMCARNCPADAIQVDKETRAWSIDPLGCIHCASCVHTCPKKCLSMDVSRPSIATGHTRIAYQGAPEEGE